MKNLKIYFTSDLHGYVYPTDYRDSTQKQMGMLNIINAFKKDGNTLVIDGGDTIQGSPFTTYLSAEKFNIHPIANIMNTGGYDYITLGNHEFNYGYDYLKKYLDHVNAKCLCANVTDKTNQMNIITSDIKQMENGLTVGIIGFTTDFIPVWEKAHNLTNFDVKNTLASIKQAHYELRPQVDILVGIYHGGFENDLDSYEKLSDSSENIAFQICEELNFDVLLTGHQHVEIKDQLIYGTHIVQTPPNGEKFAEITINVENEGILSIYSSLNVPPLNPQPDLYAALLPLETSVQEWLDQPVGFLNVQLQPSDRIDMALNGTLLANFINQVQLEVCDCDIACTSFANSVKGFNTSVTVRDIVSTYVYPNTLVIREISGQALKQALEVCASYFDCGNDEIKVSRRFLQPKVAHYNYDFFANVHYTFNLTLPVGQRVTSISVKGVEVKDTDTFTLAMNNYRSSGVGGYDFYLDCPIVKEVQVEMTELIIDYFRKHKHVTVDDTKYITIIK
ncbi:MAG: bifunctional metallophosphatase/5'-nucleotidase [Turicibacter sp.]